METYFNYKRLAMDIGYSYLNGGYGKWENENDEILDYRDMDLKYLNNCIRFIDRGIIELKTNKNGISELIKRGLKKYNMCVNKEDVDAARKQIIKLLENKKKEIKEYKKQG